MRKRKRARRRLALAIAVVMAIGWFPASAAESAENGNLSENGGWTLKIGSYTYFFTQGEAMEAIFRAKDQPGAVPEKIFSLPTEGTGEVALSSMAYHAEKIWFLGGETLYSMDLGGGSLKSIGLPSAPGLSYHVGYAGSGGLYVWASQSEGREKMPRGQTSVFRVDGAGRLEAKTVLAQPGLPFVQACAVGRKGFYFIGWDGSSAAVKCFFQSWDVGAKPKPVFQDYFPENFASVGESLYFTCCDEESVYLRRYHEASGEKSTLASTNRDDGLYFNIQGNKLFCITEKGGTSRLYVADLETGNTLSETDTGTYAFGVNVAGDKLLVGGIWYRVFADGNLERLPSPSMP
jgi:hypothetical protein